jgi:hypothetical protein
MFALCAAVPLLFYVGWGQNLVFYVNGALREAHQTAKLAASGFGPSFAGPWFARILGAEIAFASNPLSPGLPCWKRQFLLLGVRHSAERWVVVLRVVVLDMFS